MKNSYTLTELKAIYNAPQFIEKVKNASKTPMKAIEYIYKANKKNFAGKYEQLGGSEDDPLAVLKFLERAENGEDAVIAYILNNITKTDTIDEVVEYWGNKAIEFHCPRACFVYVSFLGADKSRHDKKFPAVRWACVIENEQMKTMANMGFVALALQHPDAYEARISYIDTLTEESELKELFNEALKRKDYSICFLIIFVMRERGVVFEVDRLEEICRQAKVESFYYFLTNKTFPASKDQFVRNDECVVMSSYGKQLVAEKQKEIYIRTMYDFCYTCLEKVIDPFAAFAINRVQTREEYGGQSIDLAIIIHASVKSAQKSGFQELEESMTNLYHQLLMVVMLDGVEQIPKLTDDVNEEKLKKALFFDAGKFAFLNSLGSIAEFNEEANCIKFKFALENGKEDGEDIVYRVHASIEQKYLHGTDISFRDMYVTGSSNMVRGGMIATLFSESTSLTISDGVMLHGSAESQAYFSAVIDKSFDEMEELELSFVEVENIQTVQDYVSFDLLIAFCKKDSYDEYYDDYEEEDEEELGEDEFDDSCTEYDGKCSAYVKFPDGKCYCYNNEYGHIAIGDKVAVDGKLSGKIGTVTKLEEYKYDSFMKSIVSNYGADYTVLEHRTQPTASLTTSQVTTQKQSEATCVDSTAIEWNSRSSMSNCIAMVEFTDGKSETYISYGVISIGDKVYVNGTRVGEIGTVRKLGSCNSSLGLSEITSVVSGVTTTNSKAVNDSGKKGTKKKKKKAMWVSITAGILAIMIALILVIVKVPAYDEVSSGGLKFVKVDGVYMVDGYDDVSYQLEIPSSVRGVPVESIDSMAFHDCRYLKSVTIPDSIKSIDWHAFSSCSGLETITLGKGIKTIEWGAFEFCSSLTSVYYNGTIEEWATVNFDEEESNPLYYAKHLYINGQEVTNINLNDVTRIESYAFINCHSISSVTIGENVTSIGVSTFAGCSNLARINIGNHVESIGSYAFSECIKLASITLPSSIWTIGGYAFKYCNTLTIFCKAQSEPSGWSVFWNDSNCPVYWGV